MKRIALVLAFMAAFLIATDADAVRNGNGKIALHFAGIHDAKANTCSFTVPDCTSMVVTGSTTPGSRYDVYVVAIDVAAFAGARWGMSCVGPFYFYGWTKCVDLEIPTNGTEEPPQIVWPACGAGDAVTFGIERSGPNVVLGIFDLYIYGGSQSISTTTDPRVGFAEICDGHEPLPRCNQFTNVLQFGTVGVNGTTGTNNCNVIPAKGPFSFAQPGRPRGRARERRAPRRRPPGGVSSP
jgi:hypothetical protein